MTGGWWFKEVHQWYTKGMKYYFLLCFVCSVKNFIDRSCFQSKLPPQSLPSYQSLSYFVFSFLFKVLKFSLWWCYTKYYKSIFLLVLPWKNVMVLWLSECFLDFIIHVWNLSLLLCCVLRQVTFLSQCLSLPKKETFYGWSQIKRCSGPVCALNSGLRGLSSRPGWVTVLFS